MILMLPNPLAPEHSMEPQLLRNLILRYNLIPAFRLADREFAHLIQTLVH